MFDNIDQEQTMPDPKRDESKIAQQVMNAGIAFNGAAAGHGQDWGLDNLSSAADHGRIVYETKNVKAFGGSDENAYLITSGDTNV